MFIAMNTSAESNSEAILKALSQELRTDLKELRLVRVAQRTEAFLSGFKSKLSSLRLARFCRSKSVRVS